MATTIYPTLTLVPKIPQRRRESNASPPTSRTHFATQFSNAQRYPILSLSKSNGVIVNTIVSNSGYVEVDKGETPAPVEVKTWLGLFSLS